MCRHREQDARGAALSRSCSCSCCCGGGHAVQGATSILCLLCLTINANNSVNTGQPACVCVQHARANCFDVGRFFSPIEPRFGEEIKCCRNSPKREKEAPVAEWFLLAALNSRQGLSLCHQPQRWRTGGRRSQNPQTHCCILRGKRCAHSRRVLLEIVHPWPVSIALWRFSKASRP